MEVIAVEAAARQFEDAASLLPFDLREAACSMPLAAKAATEEFRLRAGQPMTVTGPTGEHTVPSRQSIPLSTEDLSLVLEIASQASAHTVLDRVRNGFITVRGGHRLGICGSAVMRDKEIHNFRQISSLSIRIAKEIPGASVNVLPQLLEGGHLQSTLIVSPPGAGKTTLLRDLIRRVSDGLDGLPLRVGVADERGELAAMDQGLPQMEVGSHTDVVDGCPKGQALMILLRGMNPQVLAADEITAAEDIKALEQAAGCGVSLLATAHGGGASDLWTRPLYRKLMSAGLFKKVVLISLEHGLRHYRVIDPVGERRPC